MEEKKNTKKTNNSTNKKAKTTATNKKSSTQVSTKKTTTKKAVGTSKASTKTTTTKKKVTMPKEEVKVVETKGKETTPVSKKKDEKIVKDEKRINKEINKSVKMMDTSSDSTDEIRKLLIIIGAVCAVMLAFYFITEVVVKNKKNSNNNNQNDIKVEPVIQYEQILMGSLFNQNESDYYVFVYDKDDVMLDLYNQYVSSYNKLDSHLKVYKVNLSEDFNKSYIGEESHLSGSNIKDIKVTGTTLIRIKDKEISSSYENSEDITKKLKELVG